MHIAVLGCGAIGGTIAACLTRAGHLVTPITGNAAIAEAIARHGYRVRELDGTTWSVPPSARPLIHATDDPDTHEASPRFDLCLLVTQSTRMVAAVESVRPRLAEGAPVVCLQNGLPEEHIAEIIGPERVAGCVVGWAASMVEPGLYVRTSRGGFTVGPPPGLGARRGVDLPALARLLEPAGAVKIDADLAGTRWSKLAINCCTASLGAVGGDTLGALLGRRFVRRLALEIFAEVAAVARASGVRMAPVGGTLDIERVAISDGERALRIGSPSLVVKHSLLLAVGWKFRRLRSSMLYALERGRPPEIDFLNAEVVRRGQRLGVPTPVNAALVDEVRALFAGTRRPGIETLRAVYERAIEPGEGAGPGDKNEGSAGRGGSMRPVGGAGPQRRSGSSDASAQP